MENGYNDTTVFIKIWKESLALYEQQYADAEKYGDYGGREHAAEMIKYSQSKIDALESQLTRKGA